MNTLSTALLLNIICLLTMEHYLYLIFARFPGKQCYLIVLIGYSLMISEVEHFLDCIEWLLPKSLQWPQFTCAGMKAILVRVWGIYIASDKQPVSHNWKSRGRKVAYRCNSFGSGPKDVFWVSVSLSSLIPLRPGLCVWSQAPIDNFAAAATPELTSFQRQMQLTNTPCPAQKSHQKPIGLLWIWARPCGGRAFAGLLWVTIVCPWD